MRRRFGNDSDSSASSDSDAVLPASYDPLAAPPQLDDDGVDQQLLARAVSAVFHRGTRSDGSQPSQHADPKAESEHLATVAVAAAAAAATVAGKVAAAAAATAGAPPAGVGDGEQARSRTVSPAACPPSATTSPRHTNTAASPTASTTPPPPAADRDGTPRLGSRAEARSVSQFNPGGNGDGSSTARSIPTPRSGIGAAAPSTPSASAAASPTGADRPKTVIDMEFGDQYVGDAKPLDDAPGQLIPHGRGTLQSTSGKHCYVGDFNMRMRDGYGKLVTERFVLWSKWKGNRPDLASSARVDYTSGDKYAGYLETFHDPAAMQLLMRTQATALSKFSMWVHVVSLFRDRWGEMVHSDGSRYFGQWERDQPNGFGCRVSAAGDRYVGMFANGRFQGNGVLFTASTAVAEAVLRAAGNNRAGPSSDGSALSGRLRSREQSKSPARAVATSAGAGNVGITDGAIFDGTWENGTFQCDDGSVIFPCRTRITANWIDATHCTDGCVAYPNRQSHSRPWLQTFHWDCLLCGGSESARRRDYVDAQHLRAAFVAAKTRDDAVANVLRLITESPSVANSIKIFRRCFYFFYGTCGNSSHIGGGMGHNKLGWCNVRNAFGGCIHRGHGRRIMKEDIEGALGDVTSFVGAARRWLDEVLSPQGVAVIDEFDLDGVIARKLLDLVLHDVYPPLFNLYVQAYSTEQVTLTTTLHHLKGLTMDDLGVQFGRHNEEEKLFDPYADAINCIRTITAATTLAEKLRSLRAWSTEIDTATRMAQMKLKDEHLEKVQQLARTHATTTTTVAVAATAASASPNACSNATIASSVDSSGAAGTGASPSGPASGNENFAAEVSERSETGVQSGTPPTEFFRLGDSASESSAPASARTGSAAGAASVTSPNSPHIAPLSSGPRHPAGTTTRLLAEAVKVESGSADDLLPIHQYVLIRANVPNLIAHAQLLVDLSSDELFVDSTSQDAFVITTLHACVSILPQLDLHLRDSAGCVAPVSLLERRVDEILQPLISGGSVGTAVSHRTLPWVAMLLDDVSTGATLCPAVPEADSTLLLNAVRNSRRAVSCWNATLAGGSRAALVSTATTTGPPIPQSGAFLIAIDPPSEVADAAQRIFALAQQLARRSADPAPCNAVPSAMPPGTLINCCRELHTALQLLDALHVQLLLAVRSNSDDAGSALTVLEFSDSQQLPVPPSDTALARSKAPDALLESTLDSFSELLAPWQPLAAAAATPPQGTPLLGLRLRKALPQGVYSALSAFMLGYDS